MQVIKILTYNELFEEIEKTELTAGGFYALESDFNLTWDGGDLYLDYQIRQYEPEREKDAVIDCGGLLLCSCDILDYSEDFDGLTDEEILTDEIFRSLESAGLLYAFQTMGRCWGKFYNEAAALVKNYLEWEPCEK